MLSPLTEPTFPATFISASPNRVSSHDTVSLADAGDYSSGALSLFYLSFILYDEFVSER